MFPGLVGVGVGFPPTAACVLRLPRLRPGSLLRPPEFIATPSWAVLGHSRFLSAQHRTLPGVGCWGPAGAVAEMAELLGLEQDGPLCAENAALWPTGTPVSGRKEPHRGQAGGGVQCVVSP